MKLKINVCFCDEENRRFFGEGPYRLLRGVEKCGSLRTAAAEMGMAYSKAFGMVKRAEERLGFALTRRRIGGKGGGGSELTDEAKELLERYEGYREACAAMAGRLYEEHFSGFRPQKPAADGQ